MKWPAFTNPVCHDIFVDPLLADQLSDSATLRVSITGQNDASVLVRHLEE